MHGEFTVSDEAAVDLGYALSREFENSRSAFVGRNKTPAKVFWLHHDRSFAGCIHRSHRTYPALCEIESTTYNEGAVGDFLADFLAGRGLGGGEDSGGAAGGERYGRRALECVCGRCGRDARPGVFHAYGHGSAVHSFQRRRGVHVWARGLGREGDYCRTGGRGRGAAGGGIQGWDAVCERRGARLCRRKGGEPEAEGEPLSDQRRADGQPGGAGFEGSAAGFAEDDAARWRTRPIRTGRQRRAQDGGGAGQAAEAEAAGG